MIPNDGAEEIRYPPGKAIIHHSSPCIAVVVVIQTLPTHLVSLPGGQDERDQPLNTYTHLCFAMHARMKCAVRELPSRRLLFPGPGAPIAWPTSDVVWPVSLSAFSRLVGLLV